MRKALKRLTIVPPALIGALLIQAPAQADPQGTAALTIGVAGVGENRELWDDTVFHLGVHGDVLFGRSSNADFGIGPYLEVATHAFDEIQFGGGISALLPVLDYLPIVLSTGAYGRYGPIGDDEYGLEPGLAFQLFWGTRSYNFHSSYVMAAGLMGQFRLGLGESKETAFVIGAELDFVAMSLPFLFIINALRGGSADTDPVR